MKEIRLEASKWKTRDDFYDALLPALGAPAWHGRSLDALNDSIGSDEINELRLPFRLLLVGADAIPSELRIYLKKFAEVVAAANVALICEPPQ
jgi:RNAse (barnase) inhibitor barstar